MLTFSGSAPHLGLHAASFTASMGEMVALTGNTSGAQDTLLAILAGALPPKTGTVLFNGQPVAAQQSVFVPGVCRSVFQSVSSETTIRNFFHWYDRQESGNSVDDRQELLSALQLEDLVRELKRPDGGYYLRGVSTGEQEYLSVACGVLSHAPVLLLENPMSVVQEADGFWTFLKRRLTTRLVVYSTFNYSFLHEADRIYWVTDRTVACGTFQEMYNQCAPFRDQVQCVMRRCDHQPPRTL